MARERIVVLDFGGQYDQLIARCVREANVFAEILPYTAPLERIKGDGLSGIILTGAPDSVYSDEGKFCDKGIFELGVPLLGICYGMQLLAVMLGGSVERAEKSEFGHTELRFEKHPLFDGVSDGVMWMNHTDRVLKAPEGFDVIAHTDSCETAGFACDEKRIYGVQFHPEVKHSKEGYIVIRNFVHGICGCTNSWRMDNLSSTLIQRVKEQAGSSKVICALSGGVDSSVAAVLVHKAIGDNLTCIFVDHGLLRMNEADEVMQYYRDTLNMNIIHVDASELFLSNLKGVTDPEQKRKIIGGLFIKVFEQEAKKLGGADYLVQGTIYPDVIESGGGKGGTAVIKSHHNVGGLPKDIGFKGLIEPLRELFKDEVRALGESLGIPHKLVWRQPFPGPGLAVRILGEITPERLQIVRHSDFIFREEIALAGLDEKIWQYFTVFTGVQSVGVMGDGRTYDYVVAVRAVTSTDAMTVEFAEIPYPVLRKISSRIINEVAHVNRVVYDITGKPPGTIEWE